MRHIRRVLIALAALATVTLVLGFLGGLHAIGNSFAVFRVPNALALMMLGALLFVTNLRLAGVFVLIGAVALASVHSGNSATGSGYNSPITVYQKNLSFRMVDPAPLIADISRANPQVLTLQEVNERTKLVLEALADDLPTQLLCPFIAVGAVAVATKWPLIEGTEICQPAQGLVGFQVQTTEGPLWLISIHLHWPWPHQQAQQLDQIRPVLAALDGPIIIGGDFNMVPWAQALQSLASLTETKPHNWQNSFPRFSPLVALPIDNVLSAGTATVALRPELGSDHRGLVVQISR